MGTKYENISARTLFHFTTDIKYMLSSLENMCFMPRFCLEDTSWISLVSMIEYEMAYPMVCFCDIPLSKIKRHLNNFGHYGIGLKKDWGYKNSLTPVIYTRRDLETSKAISGLIDHFINHNDKIPQTLLYKEYINKLIMHTKPYKNESKKYVYYDEREWRWIPNIIHPDSLSLEKDEYLDVKNREIENIKIGAKYSLNFKIDDINYLIVKNENDMDVLINRLNKTGSYDEKIILKLMSKILTTDQIMHDF